MTLHEPVIVAGVPTVTLPPGDYVIRILNQSHTRNIVQIFDDRQKKLFTTALAIPNYKLNAEENTFLRFWETPAGNPIALRAWFAPGDNWGQEFVYPKGLAAKIAKETGEKVLATPAETPAELATAPVVEVTKEAEEQPLEEAYTAPAPEPAPAVVAEAAPAPAAAEPVPEPLPATGSPFPAIALTGLAAILAGAGLRKLALRRS